MPKRRRLKAREIRQILARNGFQPISHRGSHEKWRNPETGAAVIVYENKGRPLPLGTLLSIVKGSLLPEGEWD